MAASGPRGQQDQSNSRRLSLRVARAASQMRGDIPLMLLDIVMALVAYTFLMMLRFDFSVPGQYWSNFRVFVLIACAVQVLATLACGGYGRTWRHASIDEARRLLIAGCHHARRTARDLRLARRPVPALGGGIRAVPRHVPVRSRAVPVAAVRVPTLEPAGNRRASRGRGVGQRGGFRHARDARESPTRLAAGRCRRRRRFTPLAHDPRRSRRRRRRTVGRGHQRVSASTRS